MATLELSVFRKKLRYNVNQGISAWWNIEELTGEKGWDRVLDFDVFLPSKGINLQRGFVWTQEQKSEFILSTLKGMDMASICLVDLDHKIFQIIDGKQRVSTVISFYHNEFPVNYNGQDFFFNDLDKRAQFEIKHWCPRANVGYSYSDSPITDEEKIEWFLRVNFAGTAQEKSHQELLTSKL